MLTKPLLCLILLGSIFSQSVSVDIDNPKARDLSLATDKIDKIPVRDLQAIVLPDITKQIQCANLGMTWGFKGHDCTLEIDNVGCSGGPPAPTTNGQCNAYLGDTRCVNSLPILCIKKLKLNRPNYAVTCLSHSMVKEFYCGWTGAFLGLTPPVQGCLLSSQAVADAFCQSYVGCGYVMAEHHDGRYIVGMDTINHAFCTWNWGIALGGGWSFFGYSNLSGVGKINPPKMTRWWTRINDQRANCWDSLGHL